MSVCIWPNVSMHMALNPGEHWQHDMWTRVHWAFQLVALFHWGFTGCYRYGSGVTMMVFAPSIAHSLSLEFLLLHRNQSVIECVCAHIIIIIKPSLKTPRSGHRSTHLPMSWICFIRCICRLPVVQTVTVPSLANSRHFTRPLAAP